MQNAIRSDVNKFLIFGLKGVYEETGTLPKWKSRTAQKPRLARSEKRERRPSTDIDVHKTYTNMDREIVEEFISVTIDPKHYNNS